MKTFKQVTLSIDNEYYAPHALTGSTKDNVLLHLLKGMEIIEQKKLDIALLKTDKNSTEPKVMSTIHISDELWSKINEQAFNHKMITSQWIDICLKVSHLDKANSLSSEKIEHINAQIKTINDMVEPNFQQDLDKIAFAAQMTQKYSGIK